MKKAAVLAFAVVFALCLAHYFYAEDHCPVHCPSQGGQVGHVHPHHPSGETCLCFWASMFGPEAVIAGPAVGIVAVMTPPAEGRTLTGPAADIAPPPKSLFV